MERERLAVRDRDQPAGNGVVHHTVGARSENAARDLDVRDRRDCEQHQPRLRLLFRGREQLAREEVVQRSGEETARGEVDVAAHRREAEDCGPTVRGPHQTRSARDSADGIDHPSRFRVGHRELVHADLETLAVHLEARREPVGSRSRRDQEPNPQTLDERRQELLGLVGSGRLPLVHDKEDVLRQCLERAEDRAGERPRARVDRRDGRDLLRLARQLGSDRSEQVVELHRQQRDVSRRTRRPVPPDRAKLSLRPLARERCLAVAGGSREDRDPRAAALFDARDQTRALDDVVERRRGRRCDRLHHFPCQPQTVRDRRTLLLHRIACHRCCKRGARARGRARARVAVSPRRRQGPAQAHGQGGLRR